MSCNTTRRCRCQTPDDRFDSRVLGRTWRVVRWGSCSWSQVERRVPPSTSFHTSSHSSHNTSSKDTSSFQINRVFFLIRIINKKIIMPRKTTPYTIKDFPLKPKSLKKPTKKVRWAMDEPKGDERVMLFKKCPRCILVPPKKTDDRRDPANYKFPICTKLSKTKKQEECQYNCKGVLAANRRARLTKKYPKVVALTTKLIDKWQCTKKATAAAAQKKKKMVVKKKTIAIKKTIAAKKTIAKKPILHRRKATTPKRKQKKSTTKSASYKKTMPIRRKKPKTVMKKRKTTSPIRRRKVVSNGKGKK